MVLFRLFFKKKGGGLRISAGRLFFCYLVFCAVIGLDVALTHGQTSLQIDTHTGEFIVQTVIKKTKENDTLKKERLTYKRIYTAHDLNDNEQETKEKNKEIALIELGGKEKLIWKNGKSVNSNSKEKVSTPKFDLIKILEALAKFDNFTVTKIEMMWGRPHYVINFEPKPKQKTDGDIEEVVVRSRGVMYVDIEKFYIKELSAWMIRSYSRAWGLFNLTKANVNMKQEEFDDIVVMKSLVIVYRYSFFSETFEKRDYSYADYMTDQE